jgi:hypothetical protein
MIYIQDSDISYPAPDALPAKFQNQFFLTFPVAAFLLKIVSLFIPKILLAFGRAKLCFRNLTAIVAFASLPPSMCPVTYPATIFSISKFNTSGQCPKRDSAMFAIFNNCRLFHGHIITKFIGNVNPGYFAIAERRIKDAQAQGKLIMEALA